MIANLGQSSPHSSNKSQMVNMPILEIQLESALTFNQVEVQKNKFMLSTVDDYGKQRSALDKWVNDNNDLSNLIYMNYQNWVRHNGYEGFDDSIEEININEFERESAYDDTSIYSQSFKVFDLAKNSINERISLVSDRQQNLEKIVGSDSDSDDIQMTVDMFNKNKAPVKELVDEIQLKKIDSEDGLIENLQMISEQIKKEGEIKLASEQKQKGLSKKQKQRLNKQKKKQAYEEQLAVLDAVANVHMKKVNIWIEDVVNMDELYHMLFYPKNQQINQTKKNKLDEKIIYTTKNGKIKDLSLKNGNISEYDHSAKDVYCFIIFSPNKKFLFAVSREGRLNQFSTKDKKLIRDWGKIIATELINSHSIPIIITPDSKYLILLHIEDISNQNFSLYLRLCFIEDQALLQNQKFPENCSLKNRIQNEFKNKTFNIEVLFKNLELLLHKIDGKLYVIIKQGTTGTFMRLSLLDDFTMQMKKGEFNPDLKSWDLFEGKMINKVKVTPDSKYLQHVNLEERNTNSSNLIKYDLITQLPTSFQEFISNSLIQGCEISPNGRNLAQVDYNGAIFLFDIHKEKRVFTSANSCEDVSIMDCKWSPDSKYLFIYGDNLPLRQYQISYHNENQEDEECIVKLNNIYEDVNFDRSISLVLTNCLMDFIIISDDSQYFYNQGNGVIEQYHIKECKLFKVFKDGVLDVCGEDDENKDAFIYYTKLIV